MQRQDTVALTHTCARGCATETGERVYLEGSALVLCRVTQEPCTIGVLKSVLCVCALQAGT